MKKLLIALSLPYIIILFMAATPLYDIVRVETTDRTQVGSKVILDNTNNEFYAYRIWLGGEFRTNWIPFSTQANWNTAWYWVNGNSNDVAQMIARTSNWDEAYSWYLSVSNDISRQTYVDTITVTTTLSTAYGHVLVDSSMNDVDVILPLTAGKGEWYSVKWIAGSSNVFLKAPAGDWIEGYTNVYTYGSLMDSLTVFHDGTTNWYFR